MRCSPTPPPTRTSISRIPRRYATGSGLPDTPRLPICDRASTERTSATSRSGRPRDVPDSVLLGEVVDPAGNHEVTEANPGAQERDDLVIVGAAGAFPRDNLAEVAQVALEV